MSRSLIPLLPSSESSIHQRAHIQGGYRTGYRSERVRRREFSCKMVLAIRRLNKSESEKEEHAEWFRETQLDNYTRRIPPCLFTYKLWYYKPVLTGRTIGGSPGGPAAAGLAGTHVPGPSRAHQSFSQCNMSQHPSPNLARP